MSRTKLEITGKEIFTTSIPVRITDINYGNHVGNDSFAGIIHEARLQWLTGAGFTELNVNGAGLIMTALSLEFKKEVFYGEILNIDVFAEVVSKTAFNLFYRLVSSSHTVCVAKTEMLCYDYAAKKIVKIPQRLMELIG